MDHYLIKLEILNAHDFITGYWGACGGLCGGIWRNSFKELRKFIPKSCIEAKIFNKQLELSARFSDAIAIGIVGTTILIKMTKPDPSFFDFNMLIWVLVASFFHFCSLQILSYSKSKSESNY